MVNRPHDTGASAKADRAGGLRPESPAESQPKALIPCAVRLSANERQVLLGMWSAHNSEYDDFSGDGAGHCFPFRAIQSASGVDQHLVRRTVRALARKGLTAFEKGLWTDDGTPAGAGYGLTRKGRELAAELEAAQ